MKTTSEHGREFLTPENVSLNLRIAYTSERLFAALIDVTIILVGLKLLSMIWEIFTAGQFGENLKNIIWTLGFFLLRNFYFAFFEIRPVAASPGKRLLRLRVVSRDGGKLTANAVFTRGMTRELEFWLPYYIWEHAGWGDGFGILDIFWALIFTCIPLLTPDRTRAGDLIAGTCVVALPRAQLDPPIIVHDVTGLHFTEAQLKHCRLDDFESLERLVRNASPEIRRRAAKEIRREIDWRGVEDDAAFLYGYYIQARDYLEKRLAMGQPTARTGK